MVVVSDASASVTGPGDTVGAAKSEHTLAVQCGCGGSAQTDRVSAPSEKSW